MKKHILFCLFCFFCSFIPYTYSHPFLIESNPSELSVVKSINEVIIYYSEDVELSFSYIKILNEGGDRIDNNDLRYFEDEKSLVVTTPNLGDGTYTVISKVLSKIDGHIVEYAFIFGVGNVQINYSPESLSYDGYFETAFLPESVSRFPGYVGQTIILSSSLISLLILSNKIGTGSTHLLKYSKQFSILIKIGIFAILASSVLMIAVHIMKLDAGILDIINTTFGKILIIRISVAIILLMMLMYINSNKKIRFKNQLTMFSLSLVLVLTTVLISHSASNENKVFMILDYVHNFFSSIWIGGIIFFGFVLIPMFVKEQKLIFYSFLPNFSTLFIISSGVLICTGPMILWGIDDSITVFNSMYGILIITKIFIASIMIMLGGYNQFVTQKKIHNNNLHILLFKLKSALKIEMYCGIILLVIVSLLVNSSLPTNNNVDIKQPNIEKIEYSTNIKFNINITPIKIGENQIIMKLESFNENDTLDDLVDIKAHISNPNKNIIDIEVPFEKTKQSKLTYKGNAMFSFYDKWIIDIEVQRSNKQNEFISTTMNIKPKITGLNTNIIEYDLPDPGKPLHLLYHDDSIWISDSSRARLWQFMIEEEKFLEFNFRGKSTTFLTMDENEKIWFLDTVGNNIGFLNLINKKIEIISLPIKSIATSITNFGDDIWISMIDKKFILKYDQIKKEFKQYEIPSESSSVISDPDGKIWFTEPNSGKIGYINSWNGYVKEFTNEPKLDEPFSLFFDSEKNLWISEHVGHAITKFDPILKKFTKILAPNVNSLPLGIIEDKYGNLWFAQHTIDNLGMYDPHNDELLEIQITTSNSFTQFLVIDEKNKIWFAEQQSNKLGALTIVENSNPTGADYVNYKILSRNSLLIFPLVGLTIIAITIILRKNIVFKRTLNNLS
ncbi:MAG: CopD family protein [Thaumarchaeota archaeon]|nr:CopD family protein [Nitrososphaerota archaeon]